MRIIEEGMRVEDWVIESGLRPARSGAVVKPQRQCKRAEPPAAASPGSVDARDERRRPHPQPGALGGRLGLDVLPPVHRAPDLRDA